MLTPVVAERPAQPYVAIRAQVTMQRQGTTGYWRACSRRAST